MEEILQTDGNLYKKANRSALIEGYQIVLYFVLFTLTLLGFYSDYFVVELALRGKKTVEEIRSMLRIAMIIDGILWFISVLLYRYFTGIAKTAKENFRDIYDSEKVPLKKAENPSVIFESIRTDEEEIKLTTYRASNLEVQKFERKKRSEGLQIIGCCLWMFMFILARSSKDMIYKISKDFKTSASEITQWLTGLILVTVFFLILDIALYAVNKKKVETLKGSHIVLGDTDVYGTAALQKGDMYELYNFSVPYKEIVGAIATAAEGLNLTINTKNQAHQCLSIQGAEMAANQINKKCQNQEEQTANRLPEKQSVLECFCKNCGAKLPTGSAFCDQCGAKQT